MKVILVSKVINYGNIGDIVTVKDGFARNFLIPNKKAIHYSAENYKAFEDQKKEIEAKNQQLATKASEIKNLINGKDIVIIENASDDGRLYGAINSGMIAAKVNQISTGLVITKSDISLEKPIKETGVYNIAVNLHADVIAKLRLIVSRNESEVEGVIEQAKNKIAKEQTKKDEAKKVSKKSKKGEAVTEESSENSEQESQEVAA